MLPRVEVEVAEAQDCRMLVRDCNLAAQSMAEGAVEAELTN